MSSTGKRKELLKDFTCKDVKQSVYILLSTLTSLYSIFLKSFEVKGIVLFMYHCSSTDELDDLLLKQIF